MKRLRILLLHLRRGITSIRQASEARQVLAHDSGGRYRSYPLLLKNGEENDGISLHYFFVCDLVTKVQVMAAKTIIVGTYHHHILALTSILDDEKILQYSLFATQAS